MNTAAFKQAYDDASKELLTEAKRRTHFGASGAGNKCPREAWYKFRWADFEEFDGRMLRLFNRGHTEEDRFNRFLRALGITVWDYSQRLMHHSGSDSYVCIDWENNDPAKDYVWAECDDVSDDPIHIKRATERGEGPRQWGFSVDLHGPTLPMLDPDGLPAYTEPGHYGGSGDGILPYPHELLEWFPDLVGRGGVEYKTHSDKSFKSMVSKGVIQSKHVHFVQMQQYMHFFGLKWCLYVAVNKNDDDVYFEIVHYREDIAVKYAVRALQIIQQRTAPKRVSDDPSWHACRYCIFKPTCHFNAPVPQKNCRSCAFAEPVEGGNWFCNYYKGELPEDFIPQGCGEWVGVQ